MKITDIAPRRHRLSQLYIDGEAAVKVDTETLLRRGIAIGDELDDEELHALLQASAKHRAEEKALYLLEHRAHSKKELENKILGANERLLVLEHQLFADLLEAISAQLLRIQRTAFAVAQLDVLASFAEAAVQNNYVKPTVDDSDVLSITEGRHPVIEQMLKGSLFVPNDTTLDETENRMLIITGPNMAGKSTCARMR